MCKIARTHFFNEIHFLAHQTSNIHTFLKDGKMRKDDFVLFLIYKSLIQKKRRSIHVVGYMNLTKNHDNRPYSAKRGTY